MLEKRFGQHIRQLRKRIKITQEQLAEAVGVDVRTVQRWEAGENGPDFSNLEPIAKILGVPVEGLFIFQKPQKPEEKP